MQLLEAISDLPVDEAVIVPGQSGLGNEVHSELHLVGVRGDRLGSTGVTARSGDGCTG